METMERKTGRQAVVCAVHEKDTDRLVIIKLDPVTELLFCESCNSYECNHIGYALTLEGVRKERERAMRMTCKKCLNYNLQDAKYCDGCGSKLEVD